MTKATPTVGEVLKQWREAAGLRQDDVATAARARGLIWTRDTVSALESGRRELTLSEFVSLRQTAVQHDELAMLFVQPKRLPVKSAALQDAEQKAARKLRVTPEAVVSASLRLWGRTLTEERDRALLENIEMDRLSREYWAERGQTDPSPARSLQAVRGHITRLLVAQLAAEVKPRRRAGGAR